MLESIKQINYITVKLKSYRFNWAYISQITQKTLYFHGSLTYSLTVLLGL